MALLQFKGRYAGSKLGIWWAIIIPLILAAAIGFIFTEVMNTDVPFFTVFALAGIIPWFFFANGITDATASFGEKSAILKQGIFPREIIPLSSVLCDFTSFLIGFLCLLPVFLVFKFGILRQTAYAVFLIMAQLFFVAGSGMIFSTINVFIKDSRHFLSGILMIWFWVTPVFYSTEMIPPAYRWICLINPVSCYVEAYRKILYYACPLSLYEIAGITLISAAAFLAGYAVYLRNESELLKRI
ncbi:MAG: ABC transporter permease [Candidatus Omnitrophota bacterium]